MKKLFTFAVMALFIIGIIPNITPSVSEPTQTVNITFWWTEGTTEGALYTDLIAEFETNNPGINVTSVQKGYFDQPNEWNTAFLGGSEPDVLRADVTWITNWAHQGALLELDPELITDFNDFTDESVEKVMWNGKVYGIPQVVDALSMFYNVHAFEKANITVPENGFTWDEFVDAGANLTAWGNAPGFDHGNVTDFYAFNMQGYSYSFLPIQYGHGASYFTDNVLSRQNLNFNTTAWTDALTFLKSILPGGSDAMTPPVAEQGWGNIDSYFHQGKVGMIFMGPWATAGYLSGGAMFNATAYETLYPGSAPSWVGPDNLGFLKVPTGGAGKQGIHSGGHAYVLSSQTAHPEESMKLADWLAGKKAAYERGQQNHLVSPRMSTYTTDFNTTDTYNPANDSIVEGFRLNLESGITRPVHPYFVPIDNEVAPELETFRANTNEYGNVTVQGTLNNIIKNVNAYLFLNPVIVGDAGERPVVGAVTTTTSSAVTTPVTTTTSETTQASGFELLFAVIPLFVVGAIINRRKHN